MPAIFPLPHHKAKFLFHMNKWSLCVVFLEVASTVLEYLIRIRQFPIVTPLYTYWTPLSRFTSDLTDMIHPKQAPCPQEPQKLQEP